MNSMEQILKEAHRLYYEERAYRAAHDLLLSSTIEMAPDSRAILLQVMSLRWLEYHELYDLLDKYPDNVEVKKGLVEALVERHHWEALDQCDDLIGSGVLTPVEDIDIRWTLIRAVTRHAGDRLEERYRSLKEDFFSLWHYGTSGSGMLMPYSRKALLACIASIKSPSAIQVLQEVAEEAWLPEDIRDYFERKIAELSVLRELMQQQEENPDRVSG
jgi:hypothetical protein